MEVIVESGSLYPLNPDFFDVPVNVAPPDYAPVLTFHRLACISNLQFLDYEQASVVTSIPNENGVRVLKRDTDTATSDLYKSALRAVKGLSRNAEEWIPNSPELLRHIKHAWRVSAINDYLSASAKMVWSPNQIFIDQSNETVIVRLEIRPSIVPEFVIDFEMRIPSPVECTYYRANAMQIRTTKRNGVVRITHDLRVYNKLFAGLFVSCTGATIVIRKGDERIIMPFSPKRREQFIKAISYYHQRLVIESLLSNQ